MARPSSRSLHFIVLITLLVLSISQLGLHALTSSFISQNSNIKISLVLNGTNNETVMEALPLYMYSDSLRIGALVTSMSISVVSLIFATMAWPLKTKTFHRIPPCKHSPLFLSINSMYSIAVLVYLFKIHAGSAHFNPAYAGTGPNQMYPAGRFNLETWACDLSNFRPDLYDSACKVERARRWYMLPHVLVSLACMATGLWNFRKDKLVLRVAKMEAAAKQSIRRWNGSQTDYSSSERSLSPECVLPSIEKVTTGSSTPPYHISYDCFSDAFSYSLRSDG